MTTTQKSRFSAHDIAEAVIADIKSGKYATGAHIRELELAKRFSTSRGPVREALKILISQFWVSHEPDKGVRVLHQHPGTHPDAVMVIRSLAKLVAQFAAARATGADCDRFDVLVHEVIDAVRNNMKAEEFRALEWRLGLFLLKMTKSPILESVVGRFHSGAFAGSGIAGVRTRPQRVQIAKHYIDLAIALRQRDGVTAQEVYDNLIFEDVRANAREDFLTAPVVDSLLTDAEPAGGAYKRRARSGSFGTPGRSR